MLSRFGYDIEVFERCDDVGGVWSASRRYPGLRTQNGKATYAFSDFPFPRGVAEWPTGEQVQAYLSAYVERFGLAPRLRLGTEVVAADLDEAAGMWASQSVNAARGELVRSSFEHLVVANGVYCDPFVPTFEGADQHASAGGQVVHTSELRDLETARDRDVVVVGYGKSACDVAEAVSEVAASTTVVARQLLWKVPRHVGGILNYKYLVLTRLGEALFRSPELRGPDRLLHVRGLEPGPRMLSALRAIATRQDRLGELGLVPDGPFEEIARSTVSMTTDRFFAKVRRGKIAVCRDAEVAGLHAAGGRPLAELADGSRLPADLIVCGTGHRQHVPFLAQPLQRRITDTCGNFKLYRQTLPLSVPNLTFAGYNSSFLCPLSAEIGALWVAALGMGSIELPPTDEMRVRVRQRLRWSEERTQGRHAHGGSVIPFSMHSIDEMLNDIGLDISRFTRLRQWLLPIAPTAYRSLEKRLLERRGTLETLEHNSLAAG